MMAYVDWAFHLAQALRRKQMELSVKAAANGSVSWRI